jgi:hypothetical protein
VHMHIFVCKPEINESLVNLSVDGKLILKLNLAKLRGFSPQAKYTDLATTACRRSLCQLLRTESVAWLAQRILTAVNLCFLDRSHYILIHVAPQLSSQG